MAALVTFGDAATLYTWLAVSGLKVALASSSLSSDTSL